MYRSYVRRPAALETNEYELLPKDLELQETSIQKLRRLKFEIQELNEEIEKKKVFFLYIRKLYLFLHLLKKKKLIKFFCYYFRNQKKKKKKKM